MFFQFFLWFPEAQNQQIKHYYLQQKSIQKVRKLIVQINIKSGKPTQPIFHFNCQSLFWNASHFVNRSKWCGPALLSKAGTKHALIMASNVANRKPRPSNPDPFVKSLHLPPAHKQTQALWVASAKGFCICPSASQIVWLISHQSCMSGPTERSGQQNAQI